MRSLGDNTSLCRFNIHDAGVSLGFGLSYVVFNSQIQNLQNEIRAVAYEFNHLSSTVTDMGNTTRWLRHYLDIRV